MSQELSIDVPKRIPNQEALEAIAAPLDSEEFGELCRELKRRRWTAEEFSQRVQPLRPDHPYFSVGDEGDDVEDQ